MLYGVQWTTATSAGIITSTVPACIALFSFLLLKEKIRSHQLVSILFSVVGIGFITFTGGAASVGWGAIFGNLLVFLAVISEALFTIFAKRLSESVTPFQMTAAINVISLILFLPFAIADLIKTDLTAVPFQIWLSDDLLCRHRKRPFFRPLVQRRSEGGCFYSRLVHRLYARSALRSCPFSFWVNSSRGLTEWACCLYSGQLWLAPEASRIRK